MKAHIKDLSVLSLPRANLVLLFEGRVTAQTFKTLHGFTGGSDGAAPVAGFVLSRAYGDQNGSKSGPELANTFHGLHRAINHEPWLLSNLDHQPSCSRRCQRPDHGDQSNLRHAAVLPLEPVNQTIEL